MTTITEALQEIKTINKRLAVKRGSVGEYLVRDARVKDPLEREGGAVEFIKRERQAIADLETRIVAIRTEIQKANLATSLSLGGKTMSVAEWLVWRREVSEASRSFLNNLNNGIQRVRAEIQKKGGKLSASETEAAPGDAIVHLNERELLEQQEAMEQLLGDLDGKLSLLNATTTIDF